jgi:hypothetical protein
LFPAVVAMKAVTNPALQLVLKQQHQQETKYMAI